MRDYSRSPSGTWVDHKGQVWPIIISKRRLKFSYPAHAALRAFVFHRDGYQCIRCPAKASVIPENYDGTETLFTDTLVNGGHRDVLIVDHILTLKAGGINAVENFQTLCETCNKRKQREDKAAVTARSQP
jgi:5-methylcytosine-specific restriction endonuclease McrA